jgi:hypothetical protein
MPDAFAAHLRSWRESRGIPDPPRPSSDPPVPRWLVTYCDQLLAHHHHGAPRPPHPPQIDLCCTASLPDKRR